MRFHIITIFPDIFDSYFDESIIGRAIKNKLISVKFYNPRGFIKAPKNNYKSVDDKPYGGGPGMVMRAEPILKAVENVMAQIFKKVSRSSGRLHNSLKKEQAQPDAQKSFRNLLPKILMINFVPSAEKFNTTLAKTISKKYTDVILICGRYEGIDARIDKILKTKKLSIGDYVLTGGEIPAMILVDCISRQIEGVLGNFDSLEEERISSSVVYTRPEILKYKNKNYKVPKVLLSGNHKDIEDWKKLKK